MKETLLSLALLLGALVPAAAQEEKPAAPGYQFTDTKVIPTTPVKDQHRSGTCWCFSTTSFLESEILKAGGEEMHLSEMWVVRNCLREKAIKYIRMHGEINFAEGGASHDVIHCIRRYGIVPQEAYPGFNYGTEKPDFHELSLVLRSYLDAVLKANKQSGKVLSTAWLRGYEALLDSYFGVKPETFAWNGKEYTPESFRDALPIRMDDYVDLGSYTHHPFYTSFVIEIPDNWLWGSMYNVPMDEMMRIVDNALAEGYTVAWGTDVSDKGFGGAKAIGVLPVADLDGMDGTEAARWSQLTAAEKEAALYKFDKPGKERTITQEMRQEAFDNFDTTDDHGMLIMGTATDQNGTQYFKVQNSWDVRPPYGGFYYFSRPFVELKTTSLTVNKKAIPSDIRKKLGIK